MHYAAALEYLKKIQGENCKLSLDTIQRIIARLPFDVGAVKYVQVAGTNGKGSTAHFIASILQSAGWRVGLFTSPHLQDVRERIRVNGKPISRRDFSHAVGAVRDLGLELIAAGVIANLPTFFETLFLASLFHFNRRGSAWAVLEVGLGGRLDATSTVTPEISVITNISSDHTHILGKTLAAIAGEKAAIARENVPLVSGSSPRSVAARIIRARALDKKAPLVEVFSPPARLLVERKGNSYFCRYGVPGHETRFRVVQKGRHQALNAAVAVRTADELRRRGWEIGAAAVARGIRDMFIPCRLEVFKGRPPLILDGAHNRAGIKVLTEYLREEGIRDITLIFGVLQDKHYPAMARALAPLAARVILIEPLSERALPAEKLLPFFRGRECRIERNYSQALAVAKKSKSTIIVCGSLYLVGEMRTVILGGKKHGRKKVQGD
jgi:dihydrofolate synthase/folylpolyglutamate synthase